MSRVVRAVLIGLIGSLLVCAPGARAQLLGTGFTYQGRLTDAGTPADGLYDMIFQPVDVLGDPLVAPAIKPAVPVSDGLFTAFLDFGTLFGPEAVFLRISVRDNRLGGAYTELSPDQAVLAAPVAQWALGPWEMSPVDGDLTWPWYVGIGRSTADWPLDVQAPQAVGRFESTSSAFGSVLELRNTTPGTPTLLGGVNFVNNLGQYRGQIAYTGDENMTFTVGGQERLRITSLGDVRTPPSTRWLSVPAAAFDPSNSSYPYLRTPTGIYVTTSPLVAGFDAPVMLPHSAVIKEIIADLYIDADAPSKWIRVYLYEHDLVTGARTELAFAETDGPSGRLHVVAPATPTTVDNAGKTYYLRAVISGNTSTVNPSALSAVRIKYETQSLLP